MVGDLLSGMLFALGLGVSGMVKPSKVRRWRCALIWARNQFCFV